MARKLFETGLATGPARQGYSKMFVALGTVLASVTAQAAVIYDNIPATLPGNLFSLGYEATQTTQWGDYVQFAPGGRELTRVTVTLSNWATQAKYPSLGTTAGFNVPLTLNLYNYVASSPTPGSLIISNTLTTLVPWRPVADASCPESPGNGRGWKDGAGNCWNGQAVNVTFDLSSFNITLPNEVVFGLAFDTQTNGATSGPLSPTNSLNYAGVEVGASVGTNLNINENFWSTRSPRSSGATAGVFSRAADDEFAPTARFEVRDAAVPLPGTLALLLLSFVGMFSTRKRNVA